MTATALPTDSITAAVRTVAARCDRPTLVTLTAAGDTVTGRPERCPAARTRPTPSPPRARAWPI